MHLLGTCNLQVQEGLYIVRLLLIHTNIRMILQLKIEEIYC